MIPASVSNASRLRASSRPSAVGDAARAVAASAGQRAVVVVDRDVGPAAAAARIADHHHLVVGETRRAMDRARLGRGGQGALAAPVEDENLVSRAVHARDRMPARGWLAVIVDGPSLACARRGFEPVSAVDRQARPVA